MTPCPSPTPDRWGSGCPTPSRDWRARYVLCVRPLQVDSMEVTGLRFLEERVCSGLPEFTPSRPYPTCPEYHTFRTHY